jgi:hypothetical protein
LLGQAFPVLLPGPFGPLVQVLEGPVGKGERAALEMRAVHRRGDGAPDLAHDEVRRGRDGGLPGKRRARTAGSEAKREAHVARAVHPQTGGIDADGAEVSPE